MKTFAFKTLKVLGLVFLSLFVSLVVWANWEKPSLAQELNLKPIDLVVFNIDKAATPTDSTALSERIANTPGVTACTVNPESKTVSVTFHNDEVSENTLKTLVSEANYAPSKVNFAAFDGPKCPVPMEYIDFLTNIKSALCFR